jgi:hypothetical protein
MALSTDRIESIRNFATQQNNPIEDLQQNVTSAVKDPFGAIINRTFFKINALVSNIEKKIDQLSQEIVKSADSRGRVTLEGSTLVITVTREDVEQAQQIKNRIQAKVTSIQKTIGTLETTLKSIQAIQTAITTLQTAINIQEIILSLNPTTGPIFTVFKKAVKIVFLKDIIKEYSNILKQQLKQNLQILDRLSEKFKNITVDIKIADEKNKGNDITTEEAEKMLIQDLLNTANTSKVENDLETVSEEYVSPKEIEYILKVEKYNDSGLIGRAYEKISGLIEEQTSPTFLLTPEELINELKSILNLK